MKKNYYLVKNVNFNSDDSKMVVCTELENENDVRDRMVEEGFFTESEKAWIDVKRVEDIDESKIRITFVKLAR